jgi:hypothetical protein
MTAGYPLAQRAGFGMLTRVFPPDLVDDVVDEVGVREQRERVLPAWLTVYFTFALWLFVGSGYEHVIERLIDGLAWARRGLSDRTAPRASSLARARDRLGPEVLRTLFERVAGPTGTAGTPGVFWRGLRIVAWDSATLTAPDTPDNEQAWGRPASPLPAASPQVRLVALAEAGTEAVIGATFGPSSMSEEELAERLLRHLAPGMVLLADPDLFGTELWRAAASTGTHLVWRLPKSMSLPTCRVLADGTYLSTLPVPHGTSDSLVIRVIDYTLAGDDKQSCCLATTLIGPEQAPATELARLYHGRWKLTTAISTFGTELSDVPDIVLRSKSAEGVAQEIWAMFCVHQAIHHLILQAQADNAVTAERVTLKNATAT